MRVRVLDFLRSDFPDRDRILPVDLQVEYRLLCSGVLHRDLGGADWTRSDVARILATGPFDLLVASRPIDQYPQELALRFRCPMVTETYENWSFGHCPDDEVAADLCALLSLITRRLIVVRTKVREVYVGDKSGVGPPLQDFPIPLAGVGFAWPDRGGSVLTGFEQKGEKVELRQELRSYRPLPVAIDPGDLLNTLEAVARQEDTLATRLVAAARRYHNALRVLYADTGLAYLLLVSAVETLATQAESYTPTPAQHMANRADLVAILKQCGLDTDQIERVFAIVMKPMPWTRQRFMRFIETYVPEDVWEETDPLYPNLPLKPFGLLPTRDKLRPILGAIYAKRSAGSHAGQPYPAYVSIGSLPTISSDAMRALRATAEADRLPPVTWFERVAQGTLVRFMRSLSTDGSGEREAGSE
jgi:hypothetical protein